jgi:sulfur carrier protein
MKVYIERPKTEKNLEFEGTLKKLLSLLKVNPETVIVAKGQELITEEEILKNTDEIRIMSVISGG